MAAAKLLLALAVCLAVTGCMAIVPTPAQEAAIVKNCGIPGALAVTANGALCEKAMIPASVKTCPIPCQKLGAALPKSPLCAAALNAITPKVVTTKVAQVSSPHWGSPPRPGDTGVRKSARVAPASR
jgi:hypothetical protein